MFPFISKIYRQVKGNLKGGCNFVLTGPFSVIQGPEIVDSRKYSYSSKCTNWELSADRANNTRKFMEPKGPRENQIYEIRGFAANRPMIKDNPFDHRNRRISAVVLTKDPTIRTTLDTKLDDIKRSQDSSATQAG